MEDSRMISLSFSFSFSSMDSAGLAELQEHCHMSGLFRIGIETTEHKLVFIDSYRVIYV